MVAISRFIDMFLGLGAIFKRFTTSARLRNGVEAVPPWNLLSFTPRYPSSLEHGIKHLSKFHQASGSLPSTFSADLIKMPKKH